MKRRRLDRAARARRSAQRRALRARLRANHRAARRAVRAQRQARRRHRRQATGDRRRRRQGLVALLALALLALLGDCRCAAPEPTPSPAPSPPAPTPAPDAEPTASGALPAAPRIAPERRPRFTAPEPEPAAWLDAFRLQVGARAPRLSSCFIGAERPGTLRWTATLEPRSGRVSDQEVAAVLDSASLEGSQRRCVLQVLADPPYALSASEAARPTAVGLVLEF